MERNFISANEAINITKETEKNYKENAKAKAMQILEEFDFNQKVQEAAQDRKWQLRDPIIVEDYDVATAICEILTGLGYKARPVQSGYNCNGYRIMVGWSYSQPRAAVGEGR